MALQVSNKLIKLTLVLCVLLLLIYSFSRQRVIDLPLNNLYTTQCEVRQAIGTDVFAIYMPTNIYVKELAQQLCHSVLLNSQYQTVSVSWQPRRLLSSEALIKQNYKLMLNREYAMAGLLPNWQTFYTAMLQIPSYEVYWFAHQDNFALNYAYLKDKRIGLLEDKNSESGYLAPLSALSQQGLDLASLDIHFYPNRELVINDFLANKLDVITSVAQAEAFYTWPASRKQRLIASGRVTWYVSADTNKDVIAKLKPFLAQFQQKIFAPIHQSSLGK